MDLEARHQRKQRQAERLKEDLDDDVERSATETVQRLGTRMTEIVKKLMDEKGLDVIFDTAATVSYKTRWILPPMPRRLMTRLTR